MGRSGKGGVLFDWCWLLAWGVASSVWCITAAQQLGATFDEPFYVKEGLEFWRTGSHSELLRLGTMPLPVDVETLPIAVWEWRRGAPFDAGAELETLLPLARAGALVFWWLLLLYGRLAGRALAGPWGGRLAVAFLACEPCLLANASLATTDMAVTACVLALIYHFRMERESGWFRRIGLCAFWFAAAGLAKASGLAFGVLCVLGVEVERLWRSGAFAVPEAIGISARIRRAWEQLRPLRRDGFQIISIGMILLFVYCGSDWQKQASFVEWAHGLPDSALSRSLVWLSEHLLIFRNAGDALARQTSHNVRGHGVYLLGHTDSRAVWYYFPVLLSIKLSLPLLILPLGLVLIRRWSLANWACLAAVVLLFFSLTCRVQIGVRLMLPLVAFAIVGLAAAVVEAYRSLNSYGRRGIVGVIGLALVWTTWCAIDVWPEGLCYTNELWGGTSRGYLCASEANYDWGQGLKELETWRRERDISGLDVWYFGTDPELARLPMRSLPLHTLPLDSVDAVIEQVRGRRLAVSTTLLYGLIPTTPGYQNSLEVLRACHPVDRTTTFLIYDFTPGPDGRPVSLPSSSREDRTAERN
jgi:hypothetical protein